MHKSAAESKSRARAGLLAGMSVLSVTPAMAYVDPGTGSMMLQMGLAAIAGALFYFRQLRMAAADWFRRVVLRRPTEQTAEPETSSPESHT